MLPPRQSEEVAQSSSDSDNVKLLNETMKALGENVLKTKNDYFDEDEAAVDGGDASKQANQGHEGKGKVEPSKVRNRNGFNGAFLSDACIQRLFSLCLSFCPFLSFNHFRELRKLNFEMYRQRHRRRRTSRPSKWKWTTMMMRSTSRLWNWRGSSRPSSPNQRSLAVLINRGGRNSWT